MTHEDAGHYGAKHPEGAKPDPAIAKKLEDATDEGVVACARAHAIATELSVPPQDVGKTLDLLELRLGKCQLGLFGYGPKRNIVETVETVKAGLKAILLEGAHDKKLSCVRLWEICTTKGVSRLEVSAACEALGIKITTCQLGAF